MAEQRQIEPIVVILLCFVYCLLYDNNYNYFSIRFPTLKKTFIYFMWERGPLTRLLSLFRECMRISLLKFNRHPLNDTDRKTLAGKRSKHWQTFEKIDKLSTCGFTTTILVNRRITLSEHGNRMVDQRPPPASASYRLRIVSYRLRRPDDFGCG